MEPQSVSSANTLSIFLSSILFPECPADTLLEFYVYVNHYNTFTDYLVYFSYLFLFLKIFLCIFHYISFLAKTYMVILHLSHKKDRHFL